MQIEMIVFVCALIVLLTLWASVIVVADEFSNRWRKAAQLIFVWCIPLLGPLVVFGVHRKAEKPTRSYRENIDLGDNINVSGSSARRPGDGLSDD